MELEEVEAYLEAAVQNGYQEVLHDDAFNVACDIIAYTDTTLSIDRVTQLVIEIRNRRN